MVELSWRSYIIDVWQGSKYVLGKVRKIFFYALLNFFIESTTFKCSKCYLGMRKVHIPVDTGRKFNDTHMEELVLWIFVLNSVQKFIEIQGWLLLTFFICLYNQLSSINSIIVQMPEKHDSLNRQKKWMVASSSNFYHKTWVCFCLNIRKRFFLEFSF